MKQLYTNSLLIVKKYGKIKARQTADHANQLFIDSIDTVDRVQFPYYRKYYNNRAALPD